MIEIICFNEKFQEVGSIDDFSSLIWKSNYYDVGDGQIHFTKDAFEIINKTAYVKIWEHSKNEFWAETLMVDVISLDDENEKMHIKGKFLEARLKDLSVSTDFEKSDSVQNIMRELVSNYAINDNEFAIDKLELGNKNSLLGDDTSFIVKKGDLLSNLRKISNSVDYSFRLNYDYYKDKMFFEVYKGLDRTSDQTLNSWAIFSREEGNLAKTSYCYDESEFKNVAYVMPEDYEKGEPPVIVDLRNNIKERARVLLVDGKNIKKAELPQDEDVQYNLYKYLLRSEGMEKLKEKNKIEKIESIVLPKSNLIYGVDYNLGDICEYIDESIGLVVKQRITSIEKTIENNEFQIQPIFGEEHKTIMKKLERVTN